MKKLIVILAAIALLPAAAMADDLSANLAGGGQGFASLQTSGSTVTYGIVVGGVGNPTSAEILQGGSVFLNLQANFMNGSAFGTVSTSAANVAALNDNTNSFTLRVNGSGGSAQGPLVNNGAGGGGGTQTVAFSAATYNVVENAGEATITVNRLGGDTGMVMVDYATADGTATAGVDYQASSGTLTWDDGDVAPKTFTVPVIDNGTEDGNRTVDLELSNPAGAELGLAEATLTIVDDESLVCVPGPTTLCLNEGGRFRAEIEWTDFQGNSGPGEAFEIGLEDSGLFYFFNQNNIEMLLKVLDACNSEFNAYWVFYAATTNVEFTLTITDTQTGAVQQYTNPLGTPAEPVLDTSAFATCP